MKYDNDNIRRQDRLLTEQKAIALLRNAEYGVLSMIETMSDGSTGSYAIPLNFVWSEPDVLYFHCARQGYKLDCIEANPNVSFCIVGATNIIPHQFTTAYESVVLRGKAHTRLSAEERMCALVMLLDKYTPSEKERGLKYAEKSFERTEIIRFDILTASGKTKQVLP